MEPCTLYGCCEEKPILLQLFAVGGVPQATMHVRPEILEDYSYPYICNFIKTLRLRYMTLLKVTKFKPSPVSLLYDLNHWQPPPRTRV